MAGSKAGPKSSAKSHKKAVGNEPGAVSNDEQASSAKPTGKKRLGEATYYAAYFEGRPTASGEPYDSRAMTAAHKTLPFGTKVKVTALDSGETAVVRINDRGPFVDGRIIDLSRKAAEQLGMVHDGAAEVQLQILE
ncbi:septal ring lytic transglycosylase RlpA family protein [Salinicola halophyticus]|uniref:septal ring lytic transglycosylase RlpA family protein n=1 Tax=Salinicola halophyticus TaxID=1808881 RepID=UPI003F44C4F2